MISVFCMLFAWYPTWCDNTCTACPESACMDRSCTRARNIARHCVNIVGSSTSSYLYIVYNIEIGNLCVSRRLETRRLCCVHYVRLSSKNSAHLYVREACASYNCGTASRFSVSHCAQGLSISYTSCSIAEDFVQPLNKSHHECSGTSLHGKSQINDK